MTHGVGVTEGMPTARAGHIHVRAVVDMSGASLHAPPLRLPHHLSRQSCWGRGAVPNRAPVFMPRKTLLTGAWTPTRGFALATQDPETRGNGSAAPKARVGRVRTPFPRPSRRRRQEELLESLLRQLALLAAEIRHANLIQLHRIVTDQAGRAIADPALAKAMSTLDELTEQKRRQVLFVNAQYSSMVLHHRVGAIGWGELIGHLRVLCRNRIFEEYWEMTGEHRKSLPRGSLEARVGEAVDVIIDELADGPDEWWVVGPSERPPG